jgi:hypothetical protein
MFPVYSMDASAPLHTACEPVKKSLRMTAWARRESYPTRRINDLRPRRVSLLTCPREFFTASCAVGYFLSRLTGWRTSTSTSMPRAAPVLADGTEAHAETLRDTIVESLLGGLR